MKVYEVNVRIEAANSTRAEYLAGLLRESLSTFPLPCAVESVDEKVASLADADRFAEVAHEGQFDKIGNPYIEHVRAVAAGLVHCPLETQIAALLHDVVEDTAVTLEGLLRLGFQTRTVRMVEALTKQRGLTREANIRRVMDNGYQALLIKISDNAHNTHPDRVVHLDEKTKRRLEEKYRKDRETLWAAAKEEDIRMIVGIVNPSLLEKL